MLSSADFIPQAENQNMRKYMVLVYPFYFNFYLHVQCLMIPGNLFISLQSYFYISVTLHHKILHNYTLKEILNNQFD